MNDHIRILELGARGALPDSLDETSELPISVVRELIEAGYLTAADASSNDGIAYLGPRITLAGREYLRHLEVAAPEPLRERARFPSDAEYIGELIQRGRGFTYRTARTRDAQDPSWETSREKWTEWFAEAEATVKRLAPLGSDALQLISQARHLEVTGELSDEFYESRELGISALLKSTPAARTDAAPAPATHPRDSSAPNDWWNRYGTQIVIGIVATVIGGLVLALLL